MPDCGWSERIIKPFRELPDFIKVLPGTIIFKR